MTSAPAGPAGTPDSSGTSGRSRGPRSSVPSGSPTGPDRYERPWGDEVTRWVRLRAFWRLLVVVHAFLPLALTYLRDRRRFVLFGRGRPVDEAARFDRAERLLAVLLDLGPTFIKLGQVLSTRPDALPPAYIEVLSRLQDRVPPAPWPEIRPVVESEVGPVEEAFDSFDTDAISGASLGQVYTARLSGEKVAVKVLRPDIRRRVEADIRVIKALMPLLRRFAREGQAYTLENLADEFAATIRREMDYEHEALMLRTIGDNFADDPEIVMPDVVDDYSGPRVLTMEYVGGTKITDVGELDRMGVDRSRLVEKLTTTYIEMVVEDGVFHADPHPGNLAVKPDGRIVFYDFGMTGRVDDRLQRQLLDFYLALGREDVDGVIDSFVEMGALDPTADRDLVRELFEVAFESFRGEDVSEYRVEQLVGQFQGAMYEFPLRLPRELALIVRVTSVLDGVCEVLDPGFDFIAVVSDYVGERGRESVDLDDLADRARGEAREVTGGLARVPPKLERALDRAERDALDARLRLADEGRSLDRLASRLAAGFVFAACAASTTLLYASADLTATAVAAGATLLAGALFLRTLRSRSGIRARPQFTRQNLRERRGD